MSAYKVPDGKPRLVDGVMVATKGTYTYTFESAEEYIKYLAGPKDDHDVIEPEIRTKYVKCNFTDTPLPIYGQPSFNKDLKEYSKSMAEKFIERQLFFSSFKKKNANKKNEDPIFQEIILSNVHEEFEGLDEGDLDAWAERMYEQAEHMVRKLTGQDEIKHDIYMKPHFKHDPKRPGKLLPDMHILIGYYDCEGRPLRLGPDCGIKKIARIHQEMENLPQFNYLLKTRTEAWERQGKLLPEEQVQAVTNMIDKIIEENRNKPGIMHRAFIDAGIKLTTQSEGKGIKYIEVEHEGVTYRTDIPSFNKETTKELRLYFGQKAFEEKYPKLEGAKYGTFYELHTQMNNIFDKYKGQPLENLTNALLSKGIIATPYLRKGEVNGFTFTLPNKNKEAITGHIDLKGGELHFDVNNYTYTPKSINTILKKAKDFKAERYIAIDKNQHIIINGEAFMDDGLGNLIKIEKSYAQKKKEFVEWMKWLKADDETLPEFQERLILSKNNKLTFLTAAYFKDDDMVAYSKYNNRKMFEIKEDGFVAIYQNNPSSIKSALQAYAAMNQLSEEDKKAGYKLAISLKSDSPEFMDKMWLEAKLMGFIVTNHTPSQAIQEQFDNKMNDRLIAQRGQNRRSLERYTQMTPEGRKKSKKRVVLAYNKAVDNDVDRRAMALAYVDAYKMGIPTKMVMNPPRMHDDDRRRCYEHDIIKNQRLMLTAIRDEAPELYDDFVEQLKQDAPTIVIIDKDEIFKSTPEAKAILDKKQKIKYK
ncbi:hypothetical protein GR140_18990 [Pseudomonas putida]|uniref:hypothetical protein n=1 Tax=Pseudomonas putida TaxID=303 RepID=UPI001BAEB754|nr:hypothetical protein [Pseudomonas putida]QUG90752.1 hypothetical protein GR140_18990 [Pseudomonas putida]